MLGEQRAQAEDFAAIAANFGTMGAFVKATHAKQTAPLDAWYAETCDASDALVDKTRALKEELEDAQDDVKRAQIEREEERAQTLMLRERVDQAEHDAKAAATKQRQTETKHAELLGAAKARRRRRRTALSARVPPSPSRRR